MLSPKHIFELLKAQNFNFFTGVPDSLLKSFCAYISDHTCEQSHTITANEGNAVSLAAGHYLGSGSPALVYMQNSGIGNAVNPLTSITDPDVYSIPMLLMVGWRGEPGIKDEPQHLKQGRVMTSLLDSLEIPYFKLNADSSNYEEIIATASSKMTETSAPVAILVSKGTFEPYKSSTQESAKFTLSREEAIDSLVKQMDGNDIVVSTTGMASRELYELRRKYNQGHGRDFLTVGGMGHASSIALGIARNQQDRKILCLDGDGALLMHMGALGVTGLSKAKNYIHILINNGAHDSVGGQPTVGLDLQFKDIAIACGYRFISTTQTPTGIGEALLSAKNQDGPCFIEILVNKGSRSDLGRPESSPEENKLSLMATLGVINAK